jgi:quinoprotein glucose dehydrogenase
MRRFLCLAACPLAALLLVLGLFSTADGERESNPYTPFVAAASREGQQAIKRFQLPQGLQAELFAAEPLLANPVAFCFDEKGRCYVAETFRLHHGVTDNREHMNWLDDDLACRTVADRVAMYRKYLQDKFAAYETDHDRVRLLVDSDGDGVADQATVFADGFHHAAEGIGSGVLARKGDVYYACIPDLWVLRDTRGSGTADVRHALHTGYGVHVSFLGHDLHGLRFGPDGKLYFSIGDRGFNVRTAEGKELACPDSGAVLRCEPDGSDLEIVATGLRNPQSLAFDQYGNLFTGDNNSDSGDAARWVYVVEGGDSGWCIGFQYGTAMSDRGPFNAEKIWHLEHAEQPAHVVPPVAHIANGPSGVCYYPGTGLPDRYAGHFFLCDFRGSGGDSGVWSFAVRPKGAGFEMTDRHQFVWSVLATDCQFGPDGGFYVSDWVDGWECSGKGRIYRIADPERRKSAAVREVKQLLAEGFDQRPTAELVKLLEHADMRVRQEAQFALAGKGKEVIAPLAEVAKSNGNQLARLHALWGLGQVGRKAPEAFAAVQSLATDRDAEVRAQTARVLGESRRPAAAEVLMPLLQDAEPRVRFFAAQGLGKLVPLLDEKGRAAMLTSTAALLRDNADRDVYLRHAGVMVLSRCPPAELLPLAGDLSPALRLGVLLALRRQESAEVARFLSDAEPRLVAEAARAINDVPIDPALPQLANLLQRPGLLEPIVHRALNAHFRLGKPENAAAVAAFAGRADVPEKLRIEAVKMLGDWAKPAGRDRIMGLWRPLPSRPENIAVEALRPALQGIFAGPDPLRQEAIPVAAKLGVKELGPLLLDLVKDSKAQVTTRREALKALERLKDERLNEALQAALDCAEPRLRAEGRRLLAKAQPAAALASLKKALDEGTVIEQQGVLEVLGELQGPAADDVLTAWLDRLLGGNVAPEIQLDLLEAAGKRPAAAIKQKLAEFESARPKDDPLAKYREALAGGDADAGRRVFYDKADVTCLKCHKVRGDGGEVGPDLTGIGGKQKRDYLLESIVEPNRQIAKGYETVVLTLLDGRSVSGILKMENAREVRLMTAEGKLVTVAKDRIDERQAGKSAMPEDLVQKLTKRELRDLVEFLANLK